MKTTLFKKLINPMRLHKLLATFVACITTAVVYASTTIVDDTSGTITYSGTWTPGALTGYYNGTQHYSNTPTDYDQFVFTGTSIIWVGARWNNRGMTDVYIDTVYQGRVDAYSASNLTQQHLFEKTGLTNVSHTIKLVCTGVKGGGGVSLDCYTDVDEFTYSNDAAWSGTKVNDTSGSIAYNTTWGFNAFSGTYNTSESYSNTANDNAQFIFAGTGVRWIGALYNNRGQTGVYLDGALQMIVDAYSASNVLQQQLFERTGLCYGSHTIKLVCTGVKGGGGVSLDCYTDVDAFEYQTALWTGSAGFSSVQGENQWYYQQRPAAGGSATNLAWTSGPGYSDLVHGATGYWLTSDSSGWMYWTDTYPGNAIDTVRTWVAPSAGTISISGRAYKKDTGGGSGIVASVLKNGTSIWSKTLAYNDPLGYATDSDLASVSVTSGCPICFVMDNRGTISNGWSGWDPTINLGGRSWTLNTSDTLLTLGVVGNSPAIISLADAATNWNWVPAPTTLPLINSVYIGTTQYNPNWSYTSAAVDTSSGTKVTLSFTSTTPSLVLTQCWWARPGAGPVEETTSIANNSGSTVTYNDADIVTADLTVTSDNTVTLWQFNRSSVAPASAGGNPSVTDSGFTTGVFMDAIGVNSSIATTVCNDTGDGVGDNFNGFLLPFVMLDVGAIHGLYIGYTCDFGKFTTSTGSNPHKIRNVFQLWNANSFSQANNTTLSFPGMFYGAYKGNTDVGSNKMKKWFWDNKMTPTIKSHTGEPLIEADCTIDSESNFLNSGDVAVLASWGVELLKQDDTWTNDYSTDPQFGWDWSPNASYWPNGMDLGSIVHNHNMGLSLYMANRYKHVDLSTSAGESSEQTAVETRFNGNQTIDGISWNGPGFDYWRTDVDFEPSVDYSSHLAFLKVMDYMISNHSGFRWENCSGGGTKKSFDLAQRMSFGVAEDSGEGTGSLTHFRQSYYAMSYMFNPVQIGVQNADFMSYTNADGLFNFRNGFMGAWLWGIQANGLTLNTQYPLYVSLYKSNQRAILRGADVYHILKMPDGTNWDGIEFFNSALNKGSVILFKPGTSVGASPTIILQGLIPTNTYSLKFQDRTTLNSSYTSVTGSALMAGGAGISPISGTTGDVDSEIIWINY